jgi:hypothetical protein
MTLGADKTGKIVVYSEVRRGEMAEWLMAADCKSALLRVRWFESSSLHQA